MKDTTIYSDIYVSPVSNKFGPHVKLRDITKDDAIKRAQKIMDALEWNEIILEAYIYADPGGGLLDIKELATIKN
jgi:hypothetical protein